MKEILHLFLLQSFFKHLLSHHHTLFTLLPQSRHLSPSSHFVFFNPFTFPMEMKPSQWEWIGMWEWWCVCVCVFECVRVLYDTLISRWEGGSLLCNLLTPTILPHLCESPLSCSFTHSFALPFTFFHNLPPSLPAHFLLDLYLSGFASLITPSLVLYLCISLSSPSVKVPGALKPASSIYGSISMPSQMRPHINILNIVHPQPVNP